MHNHLFKAAAFLLFGELMLSIMAALVKNMSATMPHEMLVFTRNLFGLLFLLPLIAHHGLAQLKTKHFSMHLFRSLTGLSAMYAYFYIITHLPLAESALVKLSSPFFLPIIALLWLGEKINQRTVWAIMIGFTGVICVLRPGAETFQPVALIGIGGAVLASIAKVSIRKMANTEPNYRIVFYFGLLASLVSSVPLIWAWQTPQWQDLPWLMGIGLTGTLGQLYMTRAYQIAKPGQIGPYTYSAVIYSAALGWFFWNEIIVITTLIGTLLIIGAGLLNMKKTPSQE